MDSISNDQSPTPREIPEDIADALNGAAARLGIFRDRISWFEEIASTNAAAAFVAGRGAPEGTVIAANAQQIAAYRSGKPKAFNSLVGQVMKATKGKANPAQVNELLKRKLAE